MQTETFLTGLTFSFQIGTEIILLIFQIFILALQFVISKKAKLTKVGIKKNKTKYFRLIHSIFIFSSYLSESECLFSIKINLNFEMDFEKLEMKTDTLRQERHFLQLFLF